MNALRAWTSHEAHIIIRRMRDVAPQLNMRVVGSVAVHGASDNDLDLAVDGIQPADAIATIERALISIGCPDTDGPHERPHPGNWWFVGGFLDGRRIEIYVEIDAVS